VRQSLERDSVHAIGADTDTDPARFFKSYTITQRVTWHRLSSRPRLVLVDLPATGVANNEAHPQIKAEWIRRARAVVLVVDRAGVTEASAERLRSSGFLNSLLHEASISMSRLADCSSM
jgi:hypothetical protein